MRRPLLPTLACLLWLLVQGASAAEPARRVVLVRHAEKQCSTCDCALTRTGVERSRRLPDAVDQAPVIGLVYSNCRRTKETARSVRRSCRQSATSPRRDCRIEVAHVVNGEVRPPSEEVEEIESQLSRLFRSMKKGTVVVVGHDEVIRPLLESFCGESTGPVEYDDLFVLDVRLGTRISCTGVRHSRYGPPVGDRAGAE